ncbi:MAG: PAS domain S-box protein [Calditrichaeota bacterium]|nr:MAG: PAS domain S-box protein [Calditrichota bacterium]
MTLPFILKTSNFNNLLVSHHRELLNAITDHLYFIEIFEGHAVNFSHEPSIFHLAGYEKQELDSSPALWQHIIYHEDRALVNRMYEKAFRGEDLSKPIEYRIVHHGGSIRWVQDMLVVQKNDEGYPVSCAGLVTEITSRKDRELGRSYSDQRYERLVGLVADYIYTVKIENGAPVETYHGPGCSTITGYSSQDFLNDKDLWYRMVHVDDRDTVEEQARKALHGEAVPSLEHRIIHRNGTIRWVKNYIVIDKNKQGQTISYDGIIRDITDRKRAEIALRESEQRYKTLLRSVTDYIFTVKVEDGAAVETSHGPGCVAVTGFTQEDFSDNRHLWAEIVDPADREMVKEWETRALAGEKVKTIEHRIRHKNGSKRWVRNTIVSRFDEGENLTSYVGLIADITERKQAEEFSELQRQQLIQADKMATLGTLVTGVAHEINNPNNFIMLNAKILARGWEDAHPILDEYYEEHGEFIIAGMPYSQMYDNINQLIGGVSKGAVRIQKIVDSLKDFARQDKGDLNAEIDLNKVAKAAILIVHNLIRKSTRNFSETYIENMPTIKGNFQQLEQVIINLLTNSCQALQNSGKSLNIETQLDEERNMVAVIVTDEGKGLDEKQLKHIFDPFFTTNRDSGGTGLGLSISYQIAMAHGGSIEVESSPGKGTQAALYLPINKE